MYTCTHFAWSLHARHTHVLTPQTCILSFTIHNSIIMYTSCANEELWDALTHCPRFSFYGQLCFWFCQLSVKNRRRHAMSWQLARARKLWADQLKVRLNDTQSTETNDHSKKVNRLGSRMPYFASLTYPKRCRNIAIAEGAREETLTNSGQKSGEKRPFFGKLSK